MTLHRAKGLEFDTVILPGLARPPRQEDDPPLRWRLREQRRRRRARMLVAPLHARVGATAAGRSRVRVPALARCRRGRGGTRAPAVRGMHAREAASAPGGGAGDQGGDREDAAAMGRAAQGFRVVATGTARWRRCCLRSRRRWRRRRRRRQPDARLPLDATRRRRSCGYPLPGRGPRCRRRSRWRSRPTVIDVDAPAYDWAQATAAAIGTVAHRLLAQVAAEGLAAWTDGPGRAAARPRVLVELAAEGVERTQRAGRGGARARGRAAHAGRCARALAVRGRPSRRPQRVCARRRRRGRHRARHARPHVRRGRRTAGSSTSRPARTRAATAQAFLDREVERYRPQLERYARIMQALDPQPVMLALYFPLVDGGWRAWPYDAAPPSAERGTPKCDRIQAFVSFACAHRDLRRRRAGPQRADSSRTSRSGRLHRWR